MTQEPKPLPLLRQMIGNVKRGWGQRGIWGNRKVGKFASASGHKHTQENARRRAQIAKGMLKV
jgi:hypothetical protein